MKLRKEMEGNIEDSMDRISQVPEFIIHNIMSYLDSPKDRVRMSVLSKYWFAIMASFPNLDFNIRKFEQVMKLYCVTFNPNKNGNVRDMFFKYVEYTTSRFCQQNVSAHTFNLVTELFDSTEADLVDRCLGLILKKDVKVLNIDTCFRTIWTRLPQYRLPNQLLSASSLTSLKIRACKFPSSLMVDPLRFNSLKLLRLERLHLSDENIKYLTCNCPLLEELVVKSCNGFKRICVYGLQNLQKVEIFGLVEIIDIEAPNLRDICVINMGSSEVPSVNLVSCKKLKTLTYHSIPPLKSEVFSGFLSNIPFIEDLTLGLPENCKYLRLSSSSLRTLELLTDSDLEEIDITTPNLLSFKYYTLSNLPVLVVRDSLQPKARLECYPEDDVDSLWFQKLRQLLDTETGFKVLKLQICADFLDVEDLKMIQSRPNELEHIDLELRMIGGLSVYEALVDAVLWCCCPRSLNLTSRFQTINSEERNQVVKYIYEKLLQQEDEGRINIRMVLSSYTKAEKHFSDLNSLLTALPCVGQEHVIAFIKEQADQEAAG